VYLGRVLLVGAGSHGPHSEGGKNVNRTVFITYYDDKGNPLKSRMRENLKSGSVSGLIVSPDENFRRRWL
jgi:hypothetical protein